MAIVLLESCGHITTTGDLLKKWKVSASLNSFAPTGSARGGPAFNMSTVNGLIYPTTGSPVSMVWGCRFVISQYPNNATLILSLNEGLSSHVGVAIGTNGDLRVYRAGSSGTLLQQTAPAIITPGTFHHLAMKATIHDTTGSYDVRLDNVSVLSGTNVDTRNAGTGVAERVQFIGVVNSTTAHDFFIFDTTGGVNNDFPGDVRVDCLMPEAAGNYTQWTPSAGSNFQNVDDSDPNDDTDYNFNGTAGQKDSYQHAALTALTTEDIKGVQTIYWVKKSDAGSRSLKVGIRTNSTDYLDAGTTLPTGYEPFVKTYDVNPNTAAAWTKTDVDALETLVETV